MHCVFIISHLESSGPVNALYDSIKALIDFNVYKPEDIHLITLSPETTGSRLADFIDIGVSHSFFRVNLISLPIALLKIRLFLKRETISVVHSICVKADIVNVLTKVNRRYRTFSTVENVPSEDLGFLFPGILGRFLSSVHYWSLSCIDHLISVSKRVQEDLIIKISRDSDVVYNPLPVSATPILEHEEADYFRDDLVSMSSISNRKNVARLLELFHKTNLNNRILVFGQGDQRAILESVYKDDKRIVWTGYTNDVVGVLKKAKLLISASLSEGLPLTPQIAILCGCPCVLSNIPQHAEIAKLAPGAVFLFDVNSEESFQTALSDALAVDYTDLRQSADKLRISVSPKYFADAFRLIYHER